MTAERATAEVFLTAFKALPKQEKSVFLSALIEDKNLREDIIDMAIANERSKESSRPLKNFLSELHKEKPHK